MVQASIPHVHGIEKNEWKKTGNCEICKIEKSNRVPGKVTTNNEKGPVKAVGRPFRCGWRDEAYEH